MSEGRNTEANGSGRPNARDIPFSARLTVPAEVLLRDLKGEAVILSLASETYFGLDDIGTRMWEVLTTSPSIEAAFEILAAEFAVDPATLRRDIETLVGQLLDHHLLELSAGPAT